MARPKHDWYFNAWLNHADKSQEDLQEIGFNKSKSSLFANGKQRYHRDDINALAAYLDIEPFELLLPPDRAMAYRKYRASAEQIINLAPEPEPPDSGELIARRVAQKPAPRKRRTGTDG